MTDPTEWSAETLVLIAIIACCGWTAWLTHRFTTRSFRKDERARRQHERFTSAPWSS